MFRRLLRELLSPIAFVVQEPVGDDLFKNTVGRRPHGFMPVQLGLVFVHEEGADDATDAVEAFIIKRRISQAPFLDEVPDVPFLPIENGLIHPDSAAGHFDRAGAAGPAIALFGSDAHDSMYQRVAYQRLDDFGLGRVLF